MPQITPIQNNFAAGEISPRFLARHDIAGYKAGVREMLNMMGFIHGPATTRKGSHHGDIIPGEYGRLFTYVQNSQESFAVIVSDDGNLYVKDDEGNIISGTYVTNGDFNDGAVAWTVGSGNGGYVVFLAGECGIGVSDNPNAYAYIEQEVTMGAPDEDHTLVLKLSHQDGIPDAYRVMVGTAQGLADISDEDATSDTYRMTFDSGSNVTVWVRIEIDNTWFAPVAKHRVFRTVALFIILSGEGGIVIAHPWNQQDIKELQADMPPGGGVMYFVTRRVAPQQLVYDYASSAWGFIPVSITVPPADWVAGNYPGSITFSKGRMWLGGTYSLPDTFWGSVSGDYTNFDPGTQALPAEALSFTLSTFGGIVWMAGIKNFLIGTSKGEHVVTSEGGVIHQGDIHVDQQSAYGSARIQPILIGNRVIYVSPDRRKVREMGYQWTDEGWLSTDLTFMSEHLTKGNLINGGAYSQNPDSFMNFTTDKGESIRCVYEKANKVVGWSKHISDGEILSITVADIDGDSVGFMLIKRWYMVGPVKTYYMSYEIGADYDPKVDNSNTENHYPVTDNKIYNAQHLVGRTVDVLIDGAIHPSVEIQADGTADLEYSGTIIQYGLSYISRMITLPLDMAMASGSLTPYTKRYSQIYVRLLESVLPTINGQLPPDRHPSTLMDLPEPGRTEDVEITNLGWDGYATITIEQARPLSCTVVAIFGDATANKL